MICEISKYAARFCGEKGRVIHGLIDMKILFWFLDAGQLIGFLVTRYTRGHAVYMVWIMVLDNYGFKSHYILFSD